MARANDNSMDKEFVDTLSYDVEFYKVNLAPALKLASGGAAALGRALEELEVCTETLAQNLKSMCSISDMEEAMGTVKKVYKDTMAKFDLVEAKDTKDEHLAYVTKKQELAEKHKTLLRGSEGCGPTPFRWTGSRPAKRRQHEKFGGGHPQTV